jgi:hypothetical protein
MQPVSQEKRLTAFTASVSKLLYVFDETAVSILLLLHVLYSEHNNNNKNNNILNRGD